MVDFGLKDVEKGCCPMTVRIADRRIPVKVTCQLLLHWKRENLIYRMIVVITFIHEPGCFLETTALANTDSESRPTP